MRLSHRESLGRWPSTRSEAAIPPRKAHKSSLMRGAGACRAARTRQGGSTSSVLGAAALRVVGGGAEGVEAGADVAGGGGAGMAIGAGP